MQIHLGENLKKLRLERNMTQENLAEFLGVTFQSVSNWERGSSYPDITLLPEIAAFFKISLDDLLGLNKAEEEKEIISKLNEYDNLTDHVLMQAIINELKEKYPNDFRILIRYLGCKVRFSEDKIAVFSDVQKIYNHIRQNCTDDRIRIKAKRAIIEYYRALSDKENSGISLIDCERIISEMPDMRDSREMFCFYGEDNEDKDEKIRNTLEEQFLLLHTVYSHYFFYDERFSNEWVLSAFKSEIDFLNFVYNDGNYGKMWRTVIYCYGHLGVRYFKLGDIENALLSFKKMCSLAIKFDAMERFTVMHSVMFEGKKFDKHTLGSTYIAKNQIKDLLTERYPLPDEFKNSDEFKEIIATIS